MQRIFAFWRLVYLASFLLMALGAPEDYLSVYPPADQYVRRNSPRTTIIGNYLYIDGGDMSWLDPAGRTGTNIEKCLNLTLSIDMTQSWNTRDVKINSIPKPAPVLGRQAISQNIEAHNFYIWGGFSRLAEERKKVSAGKQWKFEADGQGGGSWTEEAPANPGLLQSLTISEDGTYTTVNDTMFYIGGLASGWTDPGREIVQPVPGVLSFNMSTKVWRNDSAAGLSTHGTLRAGVAEYVPRFGPNGIVLVLGGLTYKLDPGDNPLELQSFSTVKFFDPITMKWYSQATTGDIPAPRSRPCSVGVEDDEKGTHEIFIFGGTDQFNEQTFEDMYVLSLPGFVWHKVESQSDSGPRSGHSCIIVGKRQMLSVGGMNDRSKVKWTEPDPFSNGMGIMDLTTLTWGSEYDAGADEYTSPDMVRKWYDQGKLASVRWSSKDVEELFLGSTGAATDEEAPSQSGSADESKPNEPNSGTSMDVIIGGVIGGVAGVVVVACIAFVMIRRWTGRKGASRAPLPGREPYEMHGQYIRPNYHELRVEEPTKELQGTSVLGQRELAVSHELP